MMKANATATILSTLLLSACAAGDHADEPGDEEGAVVEAYTSEYDDAVVTSERLQNGDVVARLTAPDDEAVLASMTYLAASRELLVTIADDEPRTLAADGEEAPGLDGVNEVLHALWSQEAGYGFCRSYGVNTCSNGYCAAICSYYHTTVQSCRAWYVTYPYRINSSCCCN